MLYQLKIKSESWKEISDKKELFLQRYYISNKMIFFFILVACDAKNAIGRADD